MEIYLIRHTTPLVSPDVCYGQSDVTVNENFETESKFVFGQLPPEIDAIYSSPLMRCTILAEKIISTSGKKICFHTDERIKEINFGNWELKKWNDIDRAEFDLWAEDIVNRKVPNGESFSGLNIRVNNFIEDLFQKNFKTVAVITHSGVIRCFLARFNNIPLIDTLNIQLDFASVNIINE